MSALFWATKVTIVRKKICLCEEVFSRKKDYCIDTYFQLMARLTSNWTSKILFKVALSSVIKPK